MISREPGPLASLDTLRNLLASQINFKYPLCRLVELIDWPAFNRQFGALYSPGRSCPGKRTRLMLGPQYLEYMEGISDKEVVQKWLENSNWQYFCGEQYFQTKLPIGPGSMMCYRQRIGELSCEDLFKKTVNTGLRRQAVKRSDFRRMTVGSTIQEKAVSFPTDGELLNRSREHLGRNWLNGRVGYQMNVALCCVVHNLRLIWNRVRCFSLWKWTGIRHGDSDFQVFRVWIQCLIGHRRQSDSLQPA